MMARGWRAESLGGVWRQAVWGLLMGLCVGAVAGAPAAMQPSSSSSSGDNGAGGEVGCERPITDVVWGFGLTLLATFVAVWNSLHYEAEGKLAKLSISLGVTLTAPISTLLVSLGSTFEYVPMVCHLHKMKNEMTIARICAMLNPWSKSPTRLLATCDIIMYVRKGEESKLINQSCIWDKEILVEDETEAMVIGEEPDEETKKNQYEKKQLSWYGKEVLLWGEYFSSDCEKLRILPRYGQLRFLRANSGFAVIAIGIQAIGYIYAVIFRSVKDLRVAPVEVLGLVFNIMLLTGVILHGTSNPCARPLVIYMNKEREWKFVNALESGPKQDLELNIDALRRGCIIGSLIFVLFICIPILLYFIITLRRATNIMIVLPLIIFVVSLLLSHISIIRGQLEIEGRFRYLTIVIVGVSFLSSIASYVWALIVTFHYWKSQHFNTRSQLIDYSQFIPFIG